MTPFSFLLTALLAAGTASAQVDLSKILALQKQLPECSVDCIQTTAAEHNCTVVDLGCQCSNMEPIIQDVTPCFVKAGCGLEDIANSAKTVFEICEVVAEAAEDSEDSTISVNPAQPTATAGDSTDDATQLRTATKSGTLALVVVVAGVIAMA